MKVFFAFLALPLLYACTPMDSALDSWIGSSINSATGQLGRCTNHGSYNGQTAYEWYRQWSFTMPAQYTTQINKVGSSYFATTQQAGGQELTGYCNVIFTVDGLGIINGWHYEGNDCVGSRYIKAVPVDVATVSIPKLGSGDAKAFLNQKIPDWISEDLKKLPQ